MEWIIYGFYERENFVIIVLDSLVLYGILKRELKLFGRRYFIVDVSMFIYFIVCVMFRFF